MTWVGCSILGSSAISQRCRNRVRRFSCGGHSWSGVRHNVSDHLRYEQPHGGRSKSVAQAVGVITADPAVTTGAGRLPHIGVDSYPVLGVSLYERTGHIYRLCRGKVPSLRRGSVNFHDLERRVLLENEWLQGQLDHIHADADQFQAVCDRVLRDGRAKSVAEVRELLEHDWRV